MKNAAETQPSKEPTGNRTTPSILFALTLVAAAGIYLWRIGQGSIAANESYSAWAAAMPGVGAILAIPKMVDPGRQLVYYIALHYYSMLFGLGLAAMRSLSVIFALVSIGLAFVVARDLFDEEYAVGVAAVWAFFPFAYLFAERARTYTLFAAVALVQFLMLWRTRRKATRARVAGCGVLGGLMLYTHLAGVVVIATELGMLARDWLRGRRSAGPWIAIAIALVLFAPFVPLFLSLSGTLVYGHWLDWLGTPHHYSVITKALALGFALCLSLWFLLGRARERDDLEPLRWAAALAILPPAAFLTGSIVLRPMLYPRYVAPSFPMFAILIVGLLGCWSIRVRNLSVVGLALAMLLLVPYEAGGGQGWNQIARKVASADRSSEPIFFETGFISPDTTPNGGFPQGYYTVPFNYYFHGPNPRITVPAYDPAAARVKIAHEVAAAGGGWLVTWKPPKQAGNELPDATGFRSQVVEKGWKVTLYRITPIRLADPAGR